MDTKAKIFFTAASILTILGSLFIQQTYNLGKMRLIACDVGQGDGMLIISPKGKQIVVDAGPGSKILDCLGAYMPFWDRKVEMILSTHPQKDHMEGFVEMLARYDIAMVTSTGVVQDSDLFREWKKAIDGEGAKIYQAAAGDELAIDSGMNLEILWPPKEQLVVWKERSPADLNETSIVVRLEYGEFCAYLTGDIPEEILENIIDEQCEVLKVSHHGSKTGTNDVILREIKPIVAIIQVGKNSYGHPTEEVLDLLEKHGVKTYRNDKNGVIEVESDGKVYTVKAEK